LNYPGKFDARLPADGSGMHSDGHAYVETFSRHATHAPADAIIVPDAQLLFHGAFKRAGVDLILSKDDRELVLHDYFKGERHAVLASPDGAHLSGDIVDALTGHTQFAQAGGAASVGKVIGHVSKLTGTATAIRNGVSIILHMGDNVEKGDAVQSGPDSTLGITFIDGTVFGLSSNARMVLNDMVYDPNGSNNSSLLSLVAGTISFVAGDTAKHGDMKVDTPVATMGIRGTAVLVEIDFTVPGQGGLPDAKFQVLVEPDGTTGSYILYDKTTLNPIATVNQAGQQININQGQVSITNAPLSPEIQKLISDVFTLKFTDNTNPKSLQHFGDSTIPQPLPPIKLASGATAIPIVQTVNSPEQSTSSESKESIKGPEHIPGPPLAAAFGGVLIEHAGLTGSPVMDVVSNKVNFLDVNAGDRPTVSTEFNSITYQNAQLQDVTATLNARQLADIAAVEVKLVVVPDPNNKNTGSATWTYSVSDHAFDFLAAGEKLTLTYMARVDNNFAPFDEWTTKPFTITITGTNDVPVITTGTQTIDFAGGTSVPGGNLTSNVPTSGTLSFDDVDLTDSHTVATELTSAVLPGVDIPPGPLKIFETALSASIATDSTGTGHGTINWQLAELPVYLADFIPEGETLTLTYMVTLTDSQGATSTQPVTVTITGTDAAAVVWIATASATASTLASGSPWSDPSNWETGTVPTATDDVIIITDQLHGLAPSYPVTIDAPAVAKSLTMNDFGTTPPQLINHSTLTIAGTFSLSADAIVDNSGTISVGGPMELFDTSVLDNSGMIVLAQGGDFKDASTISNTGEGTIELSGGTLHVLVDVANSGGFIQVDGGSTLTLNGAAITGGTVTNLANGIIDLTGMAALRNGTLANSGQIRVSGGGNALDGEIVTVNYALEVLSGGMLLLDQGTTVANTGTITIDGAATLTLNQATITGGTVTDNGAIHISGNSAVDGAAVNGGELTVDAGKTLTLDGTTVTGTTITDNGTIKVDADKMLKLSGVALSGGAISNLGTVDITGDSSITGDALSNHQLTIDASRTLALNGSTVTGGSLTNSGTLNSTGISTITNIGITNTGLIEATSGVLTIDSTAGPTLTNTGTLEANGGELDITGEPVTNTGTLQAIAGGTLKLTSITVTNSDATVMVGSGATLDLEGTAINGGSLANSGQIHVSGIGNALDGVMVTVNYALDVLSGGTLLLDQGTTVANGGTITIDATATLTLDNAAITGGNVADGGTIHVAGNSTISDASLNDGGVTIESGVALTLDNVTVTGTTFTDSGAGSIILVDGGATLALYDATINGGTINDGTSATGGSIDITGHSVISNASLNHGGVAIESGVTLTLDNVTVTGTTFTNSGASSIIQVDGGAMLTLNGADISGGTINDGTSATGGTIRVTGNSTISDVSLNDGGVTIDSGAALTLDNVTVTGTTVTFNGANGELLLGSSDFGGKIQGLAATDKLDLQTIAFGTDTTAIYDGGVLTVLDGDGHSISLTLVGDYSGAHFAGSNDGHGDTLITLNAADDAPAFASGEKGQSAALSELANTTGAGDQNPSPAASGTIHFTDIDLTDRPTATITDQSITWAGAVPLTPDEQAALKGALSLVQAGNTNNGAIDWTYAITDSALDFLGEGQTVRVVSTVTLDDLQGGATDTATITVTIAGSNDAPAISGEATTASASLTEAVDNSLAETSNQAHQAAGTLSFTDADLNDTHAVTPTFNGAVWHTAAGDVNLVADPGQLTLGAEAGVSTIIGFDNPTDGGLHASYSEGGYTLSDLLDGAPTEGLRIYTSSDPYFAGSTAIRNETWNASINLHRDDGGAFDLNSLDVDSLAPSHTSVTFEGLKADGSIVSQSFTTDDTSGLQHVTFTSAFDDVINVRWSQNSSGESVQVDNIDVTPVQGTMHQVDWNYSVDDNALDFLAEGESITVSYVATIDDHHQGTAQQPILITIEGANDAPAITAVAGIDSSGADLAEANAPLTASGTLTVADADSSDTVRVAIPDGALKVFDGPTAPDTATLQDSPGHSDAELSALGLNRAQLLSYLSVHPTDDTGGTDYVHDGTTGTLTWNFNSAPNAFDFLGQGETLTLYYDSIQPSDGHGGSHTDGGIVVHITGSNDAPAISGAGNTASYDGATATVVDDAIVVNDFDNTTLASATATISSGYQSGDTLEINGATDGDLGAIHYQYDGNTITLSGSDTLAAYQEALRLVSYSSIDTDPTAGGTETSRTVTWAVNDGHASSATAVTTVDLNIGSMGHMMRGPPPDNWTGKGDGVSWNDAKNWSLLHVPAAKDAVNVDADGAVVLAVEEDGYSVRKLHVAAGTEIDVKGTGSVESEDGAASHFRIGDALANDGTIITRNAVLDASTDFTNSGIIEAKGRFSALNFGSSGGSTIENSDGVIEAVDGARLHLVNNTVEGGEIDATGDGSLVYLRAATIDHATLTGSGTGKFEIVASAGDDVSPATILDGGNPSHDGSAAIVISSDTHIDIDEGATLELRGTIHNGGHIRVDGAEDGAEAGGTLRISGQVTLDGGGSIHLDQLGSVVGENSGAALSNEDNTIDGSGALGDGTLRLSNEAGGRIIATDAANALIIDSGHEKFTNLGLVQSNAAGGLEIVQDLTNKGTLEASQGLFKIDGDLHNEGGLLKIDGGTMEVDGKLFGEHYEVQIDSGTLKIEGMSDANVEFTAEAAGTLVLGDLKHFTGTVTGFSYGDTIDLAGIDPASVSIKVGKSGALEVHYGSGPQDVFQLAGNYDPADFKIGTDHNGGADIVWSHSPLVIETDHIGLTQSSDGTTTISGLQVLDANPLASAGTFAVAATSGSAGSSVTPSTDTGSLSDINTALTTGITYHPSSNPPVTDKVTVTVADSLGAVDTVNFVFNEAAPSAHQTVQLTGTDGKDVIFGTGHSDSLTGGAGADQFVFAPSSEQTSVQHTITDFAPGLDQIDIRQFGISSFDDLTKSKSGQDTLITLDGHDTLLLKHVAPGNLHANDFIIHPGGS
jgi:VCBS repeat-containing protein